MSNVRDNNNQYPSIRFAGFTDPWVQCKLGEITTKVKSYSLSRDVEQSTATDTQYIHYGDIHTQKADIVESKTKLPFISNGNFESLKKGDLILADASEDYRGIAEPAVLLDMPAFNIIAGLHTIALRPSENNSMFLYYLLHLDQFKHFGYRIGTGLKVFGINYTNLSDFTFYTPRETEQQKISEMIYKVDKYITANQQKGEKLQELKNLLLQKMFVSGHEKEPEIRFEGFNDSWVQHKLGDLAEIVRGASPRPIQDPKWFDKSSEIGWLRISDVTAQNGRIHHLEQRISEVAQAKTRVVIEPHLMLSIAATVGKPLLNYVKTGVHDGFLIFLNPNFELEFMFQWLESFRDKWGQYGQPGSQVNINSALVKNQSITIPSMNEQKKIGECFILIDSLITANQKKGENLQLMKKLLLQRMFV